MSTQIGISTKSQDPVNTKYKIISPLNFKNMSELNYQSLPTLDPENMSKQNCKNISSKIQIPEPFIDLKHATINATQLSEGMTFPAGPHYAPAGPQVCATLCANFQHKCAGVRQTMRHTMRQFPSQRPPRHEIVNKFNAYT